VTGFRAGAGQAAAQIFQVDAIDSTSALEQLVPEWTVLWDRADSTPFQHPQWALPWLRAFYRGESICALTMRHDGRLVGFAPMFQHRHAANSNVRQVSFIGAGVSDYLDILAEPEFSAEAAACVLQYLAGHRDRWDICDLQELPENSLLAQAAIPHGLTAAVLPSSVCPVLQLPENSNALYRTLEASHRRSLRRSMKHFADGEFSISSEADLGECLDALFRLHTMRWNALGEPGMLSDRGVCEFHRQVAGDFLRSGILRLHVLRTKSRIAAVLYIFFTHGRAYAYLDGFDLALEKLSPGSALLAHAIESAIEERAQDFDFLREAEEFKYKWGATDRYNQRLLLWRSDSRLPYPDWPDRLDARA
jgi:CelD/BcsL family acetyltransferase involved in cellulose biosynthesis